MPEPERNPVRIDPVSATAVAALETDPFYRSICAAKARFAEPTTGADYVVMVRYPRAPVARVMGGS